MFKKIIQKKLENYVKAYFKAHPEVKLIIVAGSVGKTTTKIAIGTVLSERFRVRVHEGNHNAELSAPLAILGIEYPEDIKNVLAWLAVFKAARLRIKQPADVDVVIQEVGSDRIGQVPHTGHYLKPDIAVITAVSPEHMEFFGNIDIVAQEELAAANFSKSAIINRDDIPGRYANLLTNPDITTYGTSGSAEYYFEEDDFSIDNGYKGKFIAKGWDEPVEVNLKLLGEQSIRMAVGAGAVAVQLGMNPAEIGKGMNKITAVAGRMNLLRGVEDVIIIDDTYNSSPLAASSALKTLYSLPVAQKIAVLGDMNELGASSMAEHQTLGMMCDPNQLAWLVTVGSEAEKYLAPAARQQGCQVKSFKNALEAGAFVHGVADKGAAVLFKGSQGGIYLEEAVKVILHATEEETRLVRQSPDWLKRKSDFFSQF